MVNYRDLIVGGAGAAGVAAAVLPAFSVDRQGVDLYHVTRRADARSIARDGLVPGLAPPADKQARDYTREAGGDPEFTETPAESHAERKLNEILGWAKREVSSASSLPSHDNAVFFWTREADAKTAAESMGFLTVVAGINYDEVPQRCNFAIGDTHIPDTIFDAYWKSFRGRGSPVDDEEMVEEAKDYWRDVEPYKEGMERRNAEVWTNCIVPPEAIEYIENPSTGRVIEAPTEESQAELRDFERGN